MVSDQDGIAAIACERGRTAETNTGRRNNSGGVAGIKPVTSGMERTVASGLLIRMPEARRDGPAATLEGRSGLKRRGTKQWLVIREW